MLKSAIDDINLKRRIYRQRGSIVNPLAPSNYGTGGSGNSLPCSEDRGKPGVRLDAIEISVEINAQGQVSLLGSGGSLSDQGAIKLMFKRATS